MPSLLDPTLLRGQQPGDDPTGLQTLLGSIGSALSGGVAQPNDPNTTMAAILAAGNTLANAGAPTLGPPPTTAQAILGALGSARGAAVQTGILPYLQERAQQQLEGQNLDLQVKMFDFNRRVNAANLLRGGVSAAADTTGGAPAVPDTRLAASPPVIERDSSVVAGDQANNPGNLMYAFQPGATGRLPLSGGRTLAVFPDMPSGIAANAGQLITNQDQHGLNTVRGQVTRWVSDPKANLTGTDAKGVAIPNVAGTPAASGSYIGDVAKALGVDPDAPLDFHDASILSKYILAMRPHESGPAALDPHDVTAGVQLALNPAKRVQVADASGRIVGASGAATPPGASVGAPGGPMVNVAGMPGLQVPRDVELAARNAALQSADPGVTYAAAIKDYIEKKAVMPTYRPGALPGTQVTSQGQTEASPTGPQYIDSPTQEERARMFANVPKWQDIVVTRDGGTGKIVKFETPSAPPEPMVTLTPEEAQKPSDQGGVGDAYRTGTTYQRGQYTGKIITIPLERGAGPPLAATPGGPTVVTPQQQQAMDFLHTKAQADPRIQQFQQGIGYVGRIINMAADPSRTATDDKSILAAFEKFNNPTAALSEDGQNLILTTGGPGERVQQIIAKLTGDRYLTPDVVQHVIDTVTTEAEGQRAGFSVASNMYRDMAKGRGVDPNLVTPDPDEMVKQYMQQWQQSRQRLSSGTGVGGRNPVPGAAPTERAGNLPTVPVPTPATLGGMTPQGLAALVNDIKTNPRYGSQEQRQLHLDAVQAEINRRPKMQPAQGGGG